MTTTLPTIDEINLDCIDHDELVAFAIAIGNGVRPVKQAREIFPDKPTGYVQATKALRGYAWNKATAMSCRLDGRINVALQYEAICARIYGQLPQWAKW